MKQLVLPKEYNGEEVYTLPEKESHYLINVQRREIGFNLKLLDTNGILYNGIIIDITGGIAVVKLSVSESNDNNEVEIYLFQCIPKGKKIDLMIRQAVEIGVKKFFPIMADHSVPVFKNVNDKNKKRERWEKIVIEASQQSGTRVITSIEPLQTIDEALKNLDSEYTGLYFHQIPGSNKPLHETLSNNSKKVVIVIGPEGGISQREVELLKKYNFTATLLGDNILRAETATTFSLGAVKMIILERNSWKRV